eukprot:2668610-Pleurochrysis_carterae.AAC.1
MADVWGTRSWAERHFAEGLGFWEVNVFKALVYFYPQWKLLPHDAFRARLAWALMTLGKAPFPHDTREQSAPTSAMGQTPSGGDSGGGGGGGGASGGGSGGRGAPMPTAPLPGGSHTYARLGQ